MTNQTLVKPMAFVGEEISHELGKTMITDYQAANQNDVIYYEIGRNIIAQILDQPGCEGVRFYNAYNELGQKTLVYVGLNKDGKAILEHISVNHEGALETNKGIVADRVVVRDREERETDADDWNWTVD